MHHGKRYKVLCPNVIYADSSPENGPFALPALRKNRHGMIDKFPSTVYLGVERGCGKIGIPNPCPDELDLRMLRFAKPWSLAPLFWGSALA